MHVISRLTDKNISTKNTLVRSIFFVRFKNNLMSILYGLKIWRIIFYIFYAVVSFVLQIKVVIEEVIIFTKPLSLSLGYFKIPIIVYFIGTYFTLLPNYIIFILVFVPYKFVMPILGLAILVSFFIVLAL